MNNRYLDAAVRQDLQKKMVFVSGPRQVGKTTFARSLLQPAEKARYLNWDDDATRERILAGRMPEGPGLIALDEVHKYANWRQAVKGLYDTRKDEVQVLVTGSARLDYYRHGGDSLQGRYHFHRLHPLSAAELGINTSGDLENLLRYSGFPEPFFGQDEREARRWSREYRTRLVREDLRDLERVSELGLMERLSMRLPELVGSPLSINALRKDLQVAHQTVAHWIAIFERMYYVFRIYPFGAPRLRAVKKEAKHYHFDWTLVKGEGLRFENMTACHLLKWCEHRIDTEGVEMELRYFRDVDGREVDFVVMEEGKPLWFVECKAQAREPGKGLRYLRARFPGVEALQISLRDEGGGFATRDGIVCQPAVEFFKRLV